MLLNCHKELSKQCRRKEELRSKKREKSKNKLFNAGKVELKYPVYIEKQGEYYQSYNEHNEKLVGYPKQRMHTPDNDRASIE